MVQMLVVVVVLWGARGWGSSNALGCWGSFTTHAARPGMQ